IEKSRDMMLSWLCVGLFTHAAMTTPGIEVLFQSQKEDKAFALVEYAKALYDLQSPQLQKAFPLARSLQAMADGVLEFANGSRISQGTAVMRVHYSADPDRGPEWVAQERRKYSSQGAWDREQEIIHEAGGGERIFAEVFSHWSDRVIIDSGQFQPSPYWKRIA